MSALGRRSLGEGTASAGRAPPLVSHSCPRLHESGFPGSPLWPQGGMQGIHLNSSTPPTRRARRKSRPAPRAPPSPPPPCPRRLDRKPLPPPLGAECVRGHSGAPQPHSPAGCGRGGNGSGRVCRAGRVSKSPAQVPLPIDSNAVFALLLSRVQQSPKSPARTPRL